MNHWYEVIKDWAPVVGIGAVVWKVLSWVTNHLTHIEANTEKTCEEVKGMRGDLKEMRSDFRTYFGQPKQ